MTRHLFSLVRGSTLLRGTLCLPLALCTLALLGTPPAAADDADKLAAQVKIRRTAYGVPHIEGETLEAAAFGFGYCQAEDHQPGILLGVLGVRSQLAATFGPDADKPGDNRNLAADLFDAQFRVYPRARAVYDKLDADYRTMCEAFAAGLNYYAARHPEKTPSWAPEVSGLDVVAYGLSGVMRFAFNRGNLIRDFLRQQGADTAWLDAGNDGAELGSNMWAFAPSRSRSGRAILMGNPHQPWARVSTYYEAHLIVPGKMNFYGSTFIGRPVLTSGWNDNIGWSHTVNYPDLEEIYALDLDAERADHYRFDGQSVPIASEQVEIRVKQGDGGRTVSRMFWHTPLGPVVHRTPEKIYVLRSACYENYRAYEQWLRMSLSNSLAEFQQALAMREIPMFNICYADRVGNIYYLWNGTVPKLPHAAHGAEAVAAAGTADVWTEFVPVAELPQLLNPAGGYVQNCNSPPYLTSLAAPLDPAKYPAYFGANHVSLRSQHSLALIHNDRKFTLEEVRDMKHSPRMLAAERVKDDLIAALRASQPTSEVEAAIRTLEAWDNSVTADSRGATLFARWWEKYDQDGKGAFAVEWTADAPTTTPRGLGDKARAVAAFREALREVTAVYGRHDVPWGEAHRVRKGDVDLPVSGGSGLMGCFRVISFRRDADGKEVANSGDSFYFAVEFSQPPTAYTVLAYSESERPDSPHYNDQAALFSANQMKRAAFTSAEIDAALLKAYRPGEE